VCVRLREAEEEELETGHALPHGVESGHSGVGAVEGLDGFPCYIIFFFGPFIIGE